MRKLTRAVAVTALVAAFAPIPFTASAVDQSKGYPGYCTSGTGVTVVVDFQQLGGTTIVRCNPQGAQGTGLDALKGAGFQIAGVARWGEAFICRVENRPSAAEQIPINGQGPYREACVNTPPAAAYWSYWHAGNNCAWRYSQWGVKNRDFIQGGFEGWSFSLNATADTNPKPRIAAVRPGTANEACTAKEEPKPSSNDPNAKAPDQGQGGQNPGQGGQNPAGGQGGGSPGGTGGGQGGGTGGSTSGSTGGDAGGQGSAPNGTPGTSGTGGPGAPPGSALPPPKPRPSSVADDPSRNVAFTGGENAPDVNEVLKDQSGASDWAPWVAAGAVVILAAAAWLTARRRKRAREA
ncbi:ABC transporter substrate-binding protein [Actinosynnema sp. ALI-1.44]|uniref:ABC transporter substrate-binding protein n=1 Tax=Actinosynnema sp. ALI-1.44 TaxID=1933779 RepID=UPI00097C6288|nr:ABC transporter substrate-binding protein [Actinosynnema sp. ALI-1.44]ONI82858.1 ABC transporter substrate-binding protein [Actinosynnema sp. ALI-1.44]